MECFYYFFPSNTLKAKLVTWKKFSNGIIKHALLLYYFIILLLNEPSLSIDNIFTNAVQRNIQSSHHKEKLTPAFITGEKMCVGSCYEPQQCVAGIDLPLEAFVWVGVIGVDVVFETTTVAGTSSKADFSSLPGVFFFPVDRCCHRLQNTCLDEKKREDGVWRWRWQ